MLKIVPDPPLHTNTANESLEGILMQTAEYLVCALTVAQQSVLMHTKPSGQVMTLATMHEIESARSLVEVALSRLHSQH